MKDDTVTRLTAEMRDRIRSRLRKDLKTKVIRILRRDAARRRRSRFRRNQAGGSVQSGEAEEACQVIRVESD